MCLIASDIYGGTYRVFEKLFPRQGIEGSEFDASNPETLEAAIRPNSKMVIFETRPTRTSGSWTSRRIAKICRENGLICVFDNTFASPYLQTPLALGSIS